MASPFAAAFSSRAGQLGLDISADTVARLETYYRLLSRWNRTTNLTALPLEALAPEALDRLLFEPLSAAPDFPAGPVCWIDLGSGGGSPAIPLRIVRGASNLTMVEVREKKAAFLREAVRTLALEHVTVAARRFEELGTDRTFVSQADVVTARAVRADAAFVATVLGLLRPGGVLLFFESAGAHVLEHPGLSLARKRALLPGCNAQLSIYARG